MPTYHLLEETISISENIKIENDYKLLMEAFLRVDNTITSFLITEHLSYVIALQSKPYTTHQDLDDLASRTSDTRLKASQARSMFKNWVNNHGEFSTGNTTNPESEAKIKNLLEIMVEEDVDYFLKLKKSGADKFDEIIKARLNLSLLPTSSELKKLTTDQSQNKATTEELINEFVSLNQNAILYAALQGAETIESRARNEKDQLAMENELQQSIEGASLELNQLKQDVLIGSQRFIDGDRDEGAIEAINSFYTEIEDRIYQNGIGLLERNKAGRDLQTATTVQDVIQDTIKYYVDAGYLDAWEKDKKPYIQLAQMRSYIDLEIFKARQQHA